MSAVAVDVGLHLPALPPQDRLHSVLLASFNRHSPDAPTRSPAVAPWPASTYGLDGVPVFEALSRGAQAAILARLGAETLAEAFYIEKSGMAFAAKMLLLAETTEERQLYALFAADEALHLRWVSAFVDESALVPQDFHDLLAAIIEGGDRTTLAFVVQVVLEGWGLVHYRALAESCEIPALREVLRAILRDEARHHAAGLLFVDRAPLTALHVEALKAALLPFLSAVRRGPQGVLAAIDAELGPLSLQDRRAWLRALGAEAHASERLSVLRGLMDRPAASALLQALDASGVFSPIPVEELT